jgi:hypothetical protein
MRPLPPSTARGSLEGGGIRYLSRSTFGDSIHERGGFVKRRFCSFFLFGEEKKGTEKREAQEE